MEEALQRCQQNFIEYEEFFKTLSKKWAL
jgi:hypothetical protein